MRHVLQTLPNDPVEGVFFLLARGIRHWNGNIERVERIAKATVHDKDEPPT